MVQFVFIKLILVINFVYSGLMTIERLSLKKGARLGIGDDVDEVAKDLMEKYQATVEVLEE